MKRITIQSIKEHSWFSVDLPKYLFPLPGMHDHQQIDSSVVSEVCQKLSVSSEEVLKTLRSGDTTHHLAVAYELVRDNRAMQLQAASTYGLEILATSPPSSNFNMKEAMLGMGAAEGRDSISQPTGGKSLSEKLFPLHLLLLL